MSKGFCQTHNVKLPYVAGAMYQGISSVELVVAMAKANLLSFFGAGGLSLKMIEQAIQNIKSQLPERNLFGANLLYDYHYPQREMSLIDCYLQNNIQIVEASAYMSITPALVRYRLSGLTRGPNGQVHAPNRVMAKVSRPEIAKLFMQPVPSNIVADLLAANLITQIEAEYANDIPLAEDITVEADSAGHTDQGALTAIFPVIKNLANNQSYHIRVGAAGGLGTPSALAAAFILGADYVVTGSINQCTVESGASGAVKDLLQTAQVNDMAYVPAGDMFELGAKLQVYKKGLLFPARAKKLVEIYHQHASLDAIEPKLQNTLQNTYFKRSFNDVWQLVVDYYCGLDPEIITRAEQNPKQKMALVFRWYFAHTNQLTLAGDITAKTDFQIHCGPALGAFNDWVKASYLAPWQNRYVAEIGQKLMSEASQLYSQAIPHTM